MPDFQRWHLILFLAEQLKVIFEENWQTFDNVCDRNSPYFTPLLRSTKNIELAMKDLKYWIGSDSIRKSCCHTQFSQKLRPDKNAVKRHTSFFLAAIGKCISKLKYDEGDSDAQYFLCALAVVKLPSVAASNLHISQTRIVKQPFTFSFTSRWWIQTPS